MGEIDKNKAQVYVIIANLCYKGLFVVAAIVAFFIVLFKLCDATTVFDSLKYAAIEGLLCGSVYLGFRHYFPSNKP